ncbi:MAG TPA: hypothetical protein PKO22_11675, partial [Treponemataceae bacterium]|nr:hypothetical protein [Treponemataceae bacterium]
VKSVYANKITVDTLGAGSYSWRVVAIVGHNGPEIPSTYSSFTVTTAPLRKPVLRMNGDSLGRYALMRGTPAVSWNAVEGAVSYEVVISRDAQGADVERKMVTPVNVLRLVNPPSVGEYFVRVRAIAGKAYSEPSDQRRLFIAESHPLVAVSPIKTVSQSKKGEVIDFSWADPNGGSRYLFQLSANDSFEESLVSETIEGRRFSYTADASIPGTLFWKVSLIGSDGTIVATTDAQTVRIIRRLDAAVPTGPVNGERVDINDTNRIRFAWKPVEHAEAYEIDLYRVSAGLSTKVRSWRTGLCEVALENFAGLAIAEYSWAVTAIGRADGEYAPSVPVVSYFRITQSSVLPAPRINLMKPDGGSTP